MLRVSLTALLLIGCNQGKTSLGYLEDLEDIDDAGDVEDACDDYEDFIETDEVRIIFEATTGECPWDEDDNISEEDTYLTARIEQSEVLDLDTEVVICDMALDLSGLALGQIQLMVYDDYFFFTFNDVVLASSHAPAVELLSTDGGMPIYDWAEIVGAPFPDGDAPFCLGEDSGDSQCEIPSTQVEGEISMSFSTDIINELSARALDEDRFEFGFITTGDNDASSDCQHDEFSFAVAVEYLSP